MKQGRWRDWELQRGRWIVGILFTMISICAGLEAAGCIDLSQAWSSEAGSHGSRGGRVPRLACPFPNGRLSLLPPQHGEDWQQRVVAEGVGHQTAGCWTWSLSSSSFTALGKILSPSAPQFPLYKWGMIPVPTS